MSGSRENDAMTDPDRDPLIQRYHEANALDPQAAPPAALRAKVVAHAETIAAQRARQGQEAANQAWWRWSAAASVLVLVAAGWLGMRQWSAPSPDNDTMMASVDQAAKRELGEARVDQAPLLGSNAPAKMETEAIAPRLSEERPEVAVQAEPKLNQQNRVAAARQDADTGAAGLALEEEMAVDNPPVTVAAAPEPTTSIARAKEAAAEADQAMASPAMPSAEAAREPNADTAAGGRPSSPAAAAPPTGRAARMQPPILLGWREHLDNGGAPDERDAKGLTWLMRAAQAGDQVAVQALLKAGARRELQTANGQTAADLAREAGHQALARQLLP